MDNHDDVLHDLREPTSSVRRAIPEVPAAAEAVAGP
jgi:hypothetical protein